MTIKYYFFIFLALLTNCSSKPQIKSEVEVPSDNRINALQKEKEMILESIRERDMGKGVFLSIEKVVSQDSQTLLAGGAYSAGGLLRSALFISHDSGKTWNEVDAYVYGSTVSDIHINNPQINVFLTYGIEGAFFNGSLRSLDYAKSWLRYEGQRDEKNQEKLRAHIGCCFEQVFKGEFKDENEGYALIGDYRYLLLKTTDGGQFYQVEKLLGDTKKKPPKLKVFSENKYPYEYRAKEGAKKNADGVSISIEIQQRRKGSSRWTLLSEIPTFWTIDKDTLKTSPAL